MAKFCLNCGRSNADHATTLGHALRLDAPPPSRRPFLVPGTLAVLILVVVVLNTLTDIPF